MPTETTDAHQRRRDPVPHAVATVDQIPPGDRRIVEIDGRTIGIFNVEGEFYAIRNLCPHQQAPLCEGPVMDTTLPSRPGEYVFGETGAILRCPWHGWEFDVRTGRSVFDPPKTRVKAYATAVGTEGDPPAPANAETFDVSVRERMVYVLV